MLAVLVALAPGSLVSAAPVKTDHVEAELVAERTALVPGVPSTLALRLKIEDGWHTYWRNPGDSGLPTTLAWKLPPGFVASEIEWPPPRALPVGPLVNYGYEGEVPDSSRSRRLRISILAETSKSPRVPTGLSARRFASRTAPISG